MALPQYFVKPLHGGKHWYTWGKGPLVGTIHACQDTSWKASVSVQIKENTKKKKKIPSSLTSRISPPKKIILSVVRLDLFGFIACFTCLLRVGVGEATTVGWGKETGNYSSRRLEAVCDTQMSRGNLQGQRTRGLGRRHIF